MIVCKGKCDFIRYKIQDNRILNNKNYENLKITVMLETCNHFNTLKIFKYCASCECIFLVFLKQKYCVCCGTQLRNLSRNAKRRKNKRDI